jgi:micrococcal nuclease
VTPDTSPTATPGSEATVRVTDVVDGDTVDVRFPDGTEDRVRLVGVDTPEVHVAVDPQEFGVANTPAGRACLRAAGHDASNYTAARVGGRSVTLEYDPNTDRRGGYDRLLAYVVVGNVSLNYDLVATGHAKVYDTDFTERARYERAAEAARANATGVWRCATEEGLATDGGQSVADSDLRFVSITADPDGHDGDNLNGEVVVFDNGGDNPLSLADWTVTDEAGHRYAFGNVTLSPGDRVRLHTGTGETSTAGGVTDVYWGSNSPIWNNDGDTVLVRNASGGVVLSESY